MAITGAPVVVVPSGGLPVSIATVGYGLPVTVAPSGIAVTLLQSGGGMPVADVGGGLAATLATYYLTAQSGAFLLTPSPITDLRQPLAIVTLQTGAFALTGVDPLGLDYATPPAIYNISPLQGDFMLAGSDMAPGVDYTLTPGIGAFVEAPVDPLTLTYSAASTYLTGPGDIKTFLVWGSVTRGYSGAYASPGTNKAFRVCSGAPDVNGTDILVKSDGTTDLAALTAWIGSFGTASVNTLYDQTGGGKHWTQTTILKMPTITMNAVNGLPVMTFNAGNGTILQNATGITQAQPFSLAAVAKRTGNYTAGGQIIASTGNDIEFLFDASPDAVDCYYGNHVGYTSLVYDDAFHILQATVNGASSTYYADNLTGFSGGAAGAGTLGGGLSIGGYLTSLYMTGMVAEVGIYAGTYNSTLQSNMTTAYTGPGPVAVNKISGSSPTYIAQGGSVGGLVINAGFHTALIVTVMVDGVVATAPTATWGAQSMTLLATSTSGSTVFIFGLRNPTIGASSITCSWTGGGSANVSAAAFNNVAQASDTTAFPLAGRINTTGSSTTASTGAISSSTNNYCVAATSIPAASSRTTQTDRELSYGAGGTNKLEVQYGKGAASKTMTVTLGVSAAWAVAAVDIAMG